MLTDINSMLVIIRGAGDLATGIGYRLFMSGFNVIFLETEKPTVVRRKVAFANAVYEKEVIIEGVRGKLANTKEETMDLLKRKILPVMVDPQCKFIKEFKPKIVVDAILAKKNLGTHRNMADIVIGVGPGFKAGIDVDAVIETKRGHMLGRVLLEGEAEPNTGIPGNIKGYTKERVLRSSKDGHIKVIKDIGHMVKKGEVVATVDGVEVEAKIGGIVRGMIRDNSYVTIGMKIGDIDPRGEVKYCNLISDKSRAVGGGVLEAMLHFLHKEVKC